MDQFDVIFIHFPQYRVIICKECGSAVVPAHLKTHLGTKHTYLTVKTRNCIIQAAAAQIHALAKSEEDVVYPSPTSEPVPHLTVWRDGLKCTADKQDGSQCGHIRRGLQNMQAHCREQHGWMGTRKRGRPEKGRRPEEEGEREVKPWVRDVHCQQFFKTGGFQRLFEVGARPEETRQLAREQVADPIQQQVEAAFQIATAEVEKADKETESAVQPDDNRYVTNAWLNRAGWAKHLAGLDCE